MERIKILNAEIQNITSSELLMSLERGVLITPNVDQLIKLQNDRAFYDIIKKADWVVCDSKILYLFSKMLNFVDDVRFFWYFGKQLLGLYKNPFEETV